MIDEFKADIADGSLKDPVEVVRLALLCVFVLAGIGMLFASGYSVGAQIGNWI